MKIFEVKPDENWPFKYNITAFHKWSLPGVKCSECGFVGGASNSQYPELSIPEGVDPKPFLKRWPVTYKRQAELQSILVKGWEAQVELFPGTDFGPLVGKGSGNCGDVAWAGIGTMLLSAEAIEKFETVGVSNLSLVTTEIKWRSKNSPEYFELSIPTNLKLAPSYLVKIGLTKTCEKCKIVWRVKDLPTRQERLAQAELEYCPVLDAKSLPKIWYLSRIENWGSIVASEHFKNAAMQIGLTNVLFRELQISGSNTSNTH
jgi:uncharacterized double-CXXCG motif protein